MPLDRDKRCPHRYQIQFDAKESDSTADALDQLSAEMDRVLQRRYSVWFIRNKVYTLIRHESKMIFSEKSLSVPMSVRLSVCHVPSRPVPSQKKVTETENITEQSCQMYFKVDKNTFRITLMPLLCWAR